MRLSQVLYRQLPHRMFKSHWMIASKRRPPILKNEELMVSAGITVFDPKDVLSPPVIFQDSCPPKLVEEITSQEPCYMLTRRFEPIEQLIQAQHITNSVVREGLPSSYLKKVISDDVQVSDEEKEMLKQGVLHSLALDSTEKRLPKYIDVHNRPGINLPRPYGISRFRGSRSLSHKLLLILAKASSKKGISKRIFEDVLSKSSYRYSNHLVHMAYPANYMILGDSPLEKLIDDDEMHATKSEELPDLYPFTPYVNVPEKTIYKNMEESFAVSHGCPQTIIAHDDRFRFYDNPKQFDGMTLMNAFSHAYAYAKQQYGMKEGYLPAPVIVQIIHTNRKHFQRGIFQLNSLDLEGEYRNIFWYEPWEILYSSCGIQSGKPYITDINTELLKKFKSFS